MYGGASRFAYAAQCVVFDAVMADAAMLDMALELDVDLSNSAKSFCTAINQGTVPGCGRSGMPLLELELALSFHRPREERKHDLDHETRARMSSANVAVRA